MGSSPRIRGEYDCGLLVMGAGGIIPANTGRIHRRYTCQPRTRDHPREYGENGCMFGNVEPGQGSSPRIRGESAIWQYGSAGLGIIPANTGRIPSSGVQGLGQGDHPREYGENLGSCGLSIGTDGSSPRIRGEYLLTLENPTSRTDFTSLSFSTSSSAHAGGFGPSSFHGSSSRGYWMPHQCESFHVGGFPLATMHSHNKTLLVFVCWVCHNRAP